MSLITFHNLILSSFGGCSAHPYCSHTLNVLFFFFPAEVFPERSYSLVGVGNLNLDKGKVCLNL